MLSVDAISCRYDGAPVVDDISFRIGENSIGCLLGPSGCGKTTVLRAIAGFQSIDQGRISLGERVISSPGNVVPPEKRQIGMVFQDYALFPHLNVEQNIAFGLKSNKKARVAELLALVKLEGAEKRYPHELSGGQQQRVALARALAPSPELLLLDEPFSNLDAELRKSLSLEVRDILKAAGTSAILVTHDQDEAFAFSDHVGLLYHGKLQQWDTPFNLYHEPTNRTVADFIGQGRFIPGVLLGPSKVKTEIGTLEGNRAYGWPEETPVEVLLRPDDVALCEIEHDHVAEHEGIEARVQRKLFTGSATLYTLELPTGSSVEALFPSHHDYEVGETVQIEAHVEHLIAFRAENNPA